MFINLTTMSSFFKGGGLIPKYSNLIVRELRGIVEAVAAALKELPNHSLTCGNSLFIEHND